MTLQEASEKNAKLSLQYLKKKVLFDSTIIVSNFWSTNDIIADFI